MSFAKANSLCRGVAVPDVASDERGEIVVMQDGVRRCDRCKFDDYITSVRDRVCSVASDGVEKYLEKNIPQNCTLLTRDQAEAILSPIFNDILFRSKFANNFAYSAFVEDAIKYATAHTMTFLVKFHLIRHITMVFFLSRPYCAVSNVQLSPMYDSKVVSSVGEIEN